MSDLTMASVLQAIAPYVPLVWAAIGLGFVGFAVWKGWLWLDPEPVKTLKELQEQIERGEITINEIEERIERS